jgi:hypothetical protein
LQAVAVITAVPYLFEFLAFSTVVGNWAAIIHHAMKGGNPFDRIKWPFRAVVRFSF